MTSATKFRSKTFNVNNKIVCEIDNSESWNKESFPVLQVVKEMVEVDQIIPQRQSF